jgi:hypothetical protein
MRKSGAHDLVEGDGEVADAFTGGVVDGVGYRGGGSCDADSPMPREPGSEFVVGMLRRSHRCCGCRRRWMIRDWCCMTSQRK